MLKKRIDLMNSNNTKYKIFILTLIFCLGIQLTASAKKKNKRLILKKHSDLNLVYDKKLHKSRLFKNGLIVEFKKNSKRSAIKNFARKHSFVKAQRIKKRTYVFSYPDNSVTSNHDLVTLVNNFEDHSLDSNEKSIIKFADIDEYKHIAIHKKRKKSNRKFSKQDKQWHLSNEGRFGKKAGADINVTEAWTHTKGQGMRVAVIDTGFDTGHLDINFESSGYDAVTATTGADAPNFSRESHGTAVAGIIAAKDNNKGVVGVAPEAALIPIRLISESGFVPVSRIVAAHYKAVELGVKIINNSWGTTDSSLKAGEVLSLSPEEEELYKDLYQQGILVIFAAGNSGNSNFNNSPEARSPYTVAVGATTSDDSKANYSVYGEQLDITAPGGGSVGILTTDRRDLKRPNRKIIQGYSKGNYTDSFRGTSAAAPVVAGVAALVWSANSSLTRNEVAEILNYTARKPSKYSFDSTGKSLELGHGIVDASAAVQYALEY